jgi:hypothetical protein
MTPVLMQASTKHTSTKRMSAQCDKRASAHAHKRLMLSNYSLQVQVQADEPRPETLRPGA